MFTRRLFALCAASALAVFAPLHAQDDSYAAVRFSNESGKPAKLKVWNPRSENGSFEAEVPAGKSVDLTGKDGKPLRVGLYSSQIQVNDSKPVSVISVAARGQGAHLVVWTKDGFKPKPKE